MYSQTFDTIFRLLTCPVIPAAETQSLWKGRDVDRPVLFMRLPMLTVKYSTGDALKKVGRSTIQTPPMSWRIIPVSYCVQSTTFLILTRAQSVGMMAVGEIKTVLAV